MNVMTNKKIDFTALNTLPGKELTLGSQPHNNLTLILSLLFLIIPIVAFANLPHLSNEALPAFLTSIVGLEAVLLFFTIRFVLKRKDFSKTLESNQSSIRESLKKFTAANDFSLSLKETKSDTKALMISYVDPQTLEDISAVETRMLQGKFAGFPMKLSDLVHIKVGKAQITQPLQGRVVRLTLPQKLPHMIVDCHVDGAAIDTTGAPDFKGNDELVYEPTNTVMRKINLEGDFHKYFSLYTEEENIVNALSILTPDVMFMLIEMHAMCDIEIIDNYIYFVWSERKMSKAAYEKAFMTVQSVMDQIGYKLSHGDFTSRAKPNSANALATKNDETVAKGTIFDKKAASIVVITIAAVAIPTWMYNSGAFSTSDSTYEFARIFLVAIYAAVIYVLPGLVLFALLILIIYYAGILPRRRKKINNEFRKRYRRK